MVRDPWWGYKISTGFNKFDGLGLMSETGRNGKGTFEVICVYRFGRGPRIVDRKLIGPQKECTGTNRTTWRTEIQDTHNS